MTFFDKDGNHIGIWQWGTYREDESYWRIGADTIWPWFVSTVWMGIDMGWNPARSPLQFETMVFSATGGPMLDEYCTRYRTEQQAIDGHLHVVKMIGVMVGLTEPESVAQAQQSESEPQQAPGEAE